jgi:hypothetical protein
MYEAYRIDGRFMCRTKPADKRLENATTDKITHTDSKPEGDEDTQHGLPITETIDDERHEHQVEPDPSLGAADRPHESIQPFRIMAIDPS